MARWFIATIEGRGSDVKGAIATVEIFASRAEDSPERLTLVVTAPERDPSGDGWQCRVALANRHRPETICGEDSMEALSRALLRAAAWVAGLRAEARVLTRDRAGRIPFVFPLEPAAR